MFPTDTKILVVDDMLTMRNLVKKSLNGIGFTNINEAVDGDVAWMEVQMAVKTASPYCLIISDLNMPKMSGIEFLKQVRAFDTTKNVPFVLITAELDRDHVVDAIKSGLSGYITKPFTMAILSAKLQSVWAHVADSNK